MPAIARFAVLVTLLSLALDGRSAQAGPPQPPPVSRFAPAEDLVAQVHDFVKDLEAALANEQTFNEKKDVVKRTANAMTVLAVGLGLHDTPNELKASAPALLKASQELYKAADFASAQSGLAAVKAAVEGKTKEGPQLSWNTKVASLGQLMKQVTITDSRLRRNLRRFDRLAKENAQNSALLAVIAQAAMADTHEVKDPADLPKWYQWCEDMREAAAGVNRAAKAKDPTAADAAAKRLTQSCDECHAVFQNE